MDDDELTPGVYFIGVLLNGPNVVPAQHRAVSTAATVTITGVQHSVSLGHVGGPRAANTTIQLPMFLSNAPNAEATSLQFSIDLGTPNLAYDNQTTPFGTGVVVVAFANAGGIVSVTVTSPAPIASGKFGELRFRVPPSVGAQAPAGVNAATLTALEVRNSQNALLSSESANGSVTLSNHKIVAASVNGPITPLAEIEIPISLSNLTSQPTIAGLQFKVTALSPDLEHLPGEAVAGAAAIAAGKNAYASGNGNVANVVTLGFNSGTFGNGEVVKLKFRVKSTGIAAGEYAAVISDVIATDASPTPQPVIVFKEDGKFSLTAFSPKDTNRDGSIDVVDAQVVVNLILALTTPQYPGQGDVNGDNFVDVVDAQNIVNCILAIGPCN